MHSYDEAQICFGIALEDGVKLPWDEEYGALDHEAWWRDICGGFEPSFRQPVRERDKYPTEEAFKAASKKWFAERAAFDAEHPCPVDVVNYHHIEFPIWMLIVPGTELTCSADGLMSFNPSELTVTDAQIEALLDLCKTYKIPNDGKPEWWLFHNNGDH